MQRLVLSNTFVTVPSTLILPALTVNMVSDTAFGIVTHQMSLMSQNLTLFIEGLMVFLREVQISSQSSQRKSQTNKQVIVGYFLFQVMFLHDI